MGTAAAIKAIKFFPRTGFEARHVQVHNQALFVIRGVRRSLLSHNVIPAALLQGGRFIGITAAEAEVELGTIGKGTAFRLCFHHLSSLRQCPSLRRCSGQANGWLEQSGGGRGGQWGEGAAGEVRWSGRVLLQHGGGQAVQRRLSLCGTHTRNQLFIVKSTSDQQHWAQTACAPAGCAYM